MSLHDEFPSLFWEPSRDGLERQIATLDEDIGSYFNKLRGRGLVDEMRNYPPDTKTTRRGRTIPRPLTAALGNAAREMAFIWQRFAFAGYFIKRAAPEVVHQPLQFMALYETLKRRYCEIRGRLIWTDAYVCFAPKFGSTPV